MSRRLWWLLQTRLFHLGKTVSARVARLSLSPATPLVTAILAGLAFVGVLAASQRQLVTWQGLAVTFIIIVGVFAALRAIALSYLFRHTRQAYSLHAAPGTSFESYARFVDIQLAGFTEEVLDATHKGLRSGSGDVAAWLRRLSSSVSSSLTEVIRLGEESDGLHFTDLETRMQASSGLSIRSRLVHDTRIIVADMSALNDHNIIDPASFRHLIEFHARAGTALFWISPDKQRDIARSRDIPTRASSITLVDNQCALTCDAAELGFVTLSLVFDQHAIATLRDYVDNLRRYAVGLDEGKSDQFVAEVLSYRLETAESVRIDDLPVPGRNPTDAVRHYLATKPQLALELSADERELHWSRGSLVVAADNLFHDFVPDQAVRLFGELLQAEIRPHLSPRQGTSRVFCITNDAVLPEELLVTSASSRVDDQVAHEISTEALAATPDARVAIHIVDERSAAGPDPELQRALAVNVVVIAPSILSSMARQRRSPRDVLVQAILQQADLARVSPFVTRTATPEQMFYGRDTEQAQVLAKISSRSLAVLGGRLIGKTSFLDRLSHVLHHGGYAPFLADCQSVESWDDFIRLSEHEWRVSIATGSVAEQVAALIAQLAAKADTSQVVILLDEIDRLLTWDRATGPGEKSEPVFRAFRSVSQRKTAQFVFAGERTIARRLRDPHSPHWNFCEPLFLRQLTRAAAGELLVQPLRALQVHVSAQPQFEEAAWRITSGHPQVTQVLGDQLVRALGRRSGSRRTEVAAEDVDAIAESFEFRRLYLDTYWSQTNELERLVGVLLADTPQLPADVRANLETHAIAVDEERLKEILRVLELLGLIQECAQGYELRAQWLTTALEAEGGIASVRQRLAASAK